MASNFDLDRFGPYASLHRADGTFVAVTAGFAELLGRTPEDFVELNGWTFTPEANGERRERILGTIHASGALTDVETLERADGSRIRFAYLAQVVDDDLILVSGEPVPPDGFTSTADELRRARLEDAVGERERLELAGVPGQWLTTDEAVAYSRRSESTLERAVRAGALRRGGTPRRRLFHTSWLDAWLGGGGGGALAAALVFVAGLEVLVLEVLEVLV